MSESYNPYSAMFEMQRESIDQTRQLLHWNVELSKQTNGFALETIDSTRSVQEKSNDVAHTIMTTSLDSVAAAMPGSNAMMRNVHTAIDDQFEAADEVNAQFWQAMHDILEENMTAYEDIADQYLEMVDDTFDTALENLSSYESDMTAAPVQTTE